MNTEAMVPGGWMTEAIAEWRRKLPEQFAAENKAWAEMLARDGIMFDPSPKEGTTT